MGLERIIEGQGFGIALTGMTVVFVGLVLVSLFIAVLPRVLERAGQAGRRRAPRMQAARAAVMERETSVALDPALLVAIGTVLQAEYEREMLSDHQLITMRETGEEQAAWTAIGKMRILATRR